LRSTSGELSSELRASADNGLFGEQLQHRGVFGGFATSSEFAEKPRCRHRELNNTRSSFLAPAPAAKISENGGRPDLTAA
jgi:hypothetical protein